jgi:uncharacterized membrane protein YsdA (DUF1294 family)
MTALLFLLIIFAMALIGWLPLVLAWAYFILSVITLILYGIDKFSALKEGQRVSEKTLHVFALLGGWPGAYLGQQFFRHKISKKNFMRIFWLSVFINVAVLAIIFKYYK